MRLFTMVWAIFEQAGRELAERGAVSWQTARRASQEVIPVPFFGLLKIGVYIGMVGSWIVLGAFAVGLTVAFFRNLSAGG